MYFTFRDFKIVIFTNGQISRKALQDSEIYFQPTLVEKILLLPRPVVSPCTGGAEAGLRGRARSLPRFTATQ